MQRNAFIILCQSTSGNAWWHLDLDQSNLVIPILPTQKLPTSTVKYSQHKKKRSHSSGKATQRLYILVSKYLRTRLVEDPPLVNLAAPQTLRKVRRTNRILAIVFSSNYSLLSDAVRPPQALLSKTICSSHSSSGVLPVPQNSSRSNPIFWRFRGPLDVLTVQPSCGVTAVLLRSSRSSPSSGVHAFSDSQIANLVT